MKIGADFDKIEFELFGLNLVEPNAIIGDSILCLLAIYLAVKVKRLNTPTVFCTGWIKFFVLFGLSIFLGGLGHCMFLYWGVPGKYIGWLGSIISVTFLEHVIISIHPKKDKIKQFQLLSKIKMAIAVNLELIVFVFVNLEEDPQVGLWVPLISSAIGFIFCLGYLGNLYQKSITSSFKYLKIALILMIPAPVIQYMKISIYPWFDRSDIGHCFIFLTLVLYWKTIKGYHNYLSQDLSLQNK